MDPDRRQPEDSQVDAATFMVSIAVIVHHFADQDTAVIEIYIQTIIL